MTDPNSNQNDQLLDASADLETVLSAWHTATVRLEQTHEALQTEVRRLSDELEVKNRELARKNRMADLGQIAAYVAHEVRNHLVPVSLYMSLLERRLSDDSGSLDVVTKVTSSIRALDSTVNDLLNFTSDQDPTLKRLNISQLVAETVDSLSPQLEGQQIETTIDVPEQAEVLGDHDMLRSVLLNLTLNAIDAMPEGGDFVITAYDGANGLELEVADSGTGLSSDAQAKIFEPFFTTKSGGTGLGLAIVERIVNSHGANISVMNCPEGGTAFTLQFPPRLAMEAAA